MTAPPQMPDKTPQVAAAAVEDTALSSELGRRVRAARARAGMSRRQLAAESGASERYLAQIEGGVGNPSLLMLTALARALDLAPAELLPFGGERGEGAAQAADLLRRLPAREIKAAESWLERRLSGDGAGERERRIALVGLRGAGKSTLGPELAARLDAPFVELNRQIEQEFGGDMNLLIELSGQAAFRRYERAALERVAETQSAAVISVSGGIVSNVDTYDRLLRVAHVIWLKASPEEHMTRVMAQGDFRPMAKNRQAMDDLKTILAVREPEYARAHARLDTSGRTVEQSAEDLENLARRLIAEDAL
jgi:XRE family aerobic/anaerobic benzoate catabolism transcriptional regulator